MSERRGDDVVSGIAATVAEASPGPTARVDRLGPESTTHREQPFDSAGPTMAAPFDSAGPTMAAALEVPSNETHRETPAARASQPMIRPSRPSLKDQRYVLGEEIARGGMGRVVAANDTLLGRVVAIKEALIVDGDLRERFIRETKITARLEHPSIVPVYDAGTMVDGSPFYVMRRVSGQPLDKLVHDATHLDGRLALLPNLLAAANAIAHAHGRGIVHRDIKPSNILVGELGETVVIDWGLAKVLDEVDQDAAAPMRSIVEDDSVKTRVGSVVGTPGFMPPEQLRGERVDARTDVYALGATLYFLLARRPPHAAKTGDEMMHAALAGPPMPIRELVPGVPSELLTIADKALAYRHADRYHDAGGLAADLDRFLRGQLVASHHYSRRERLVRWWRRHRLAISISMLAVVAFAVGGTLSVSRIIEARRRADAALADSHLRIEELQVAHARDMIRSSPREALELIRPIAAKYWDQAWAMALAARSSGLAQSIPSSQYSISIDIARDGTHALVAGEDGVLRVVDLAARSSKKIAHLDPMMRAHYADGDSTVIAWGNGKVQRVAPTTGVRTDLFTADIATLDVDDTTLWWLDGQGHVWTRGIDEAEARAIPVADKIVALAAQGGSVALGGEQQLWVARRDAPARALVTGPASSVAWTGDGRIAAAIAERVVSIVDPATGQAETLSSRGAHSVAAAAGGDIVVSTASRGAEVIDRSTRFPLPPTAVMRTYGASPGSPYLIAGSDASLSVWDLRQFRPRRVKLPSATGGDNNVRYDQLVAPHADHAHATWVDLITGEMMTVSTPGTMHTTAIDPQRKRLVMCEKNDHAMLYTRGQAAGEELEGCRLAYWVGDTVILGNVKGEIRAYDTRTRTSRFLFSHASPVWALYGDEHGGDWVGAVYDDGFVWRANIRTGQSGTIEPALDRTIILRTNGDALVSDVDHVQLWHVDDTKTEVTVGAAPHGKIVYVDDKHAIVLARAETAYLVDLDTLQATEVYPPGSRLHDLRYQGRLGTYIGGDDSLHLTDALTGYEWVLARPTDAPLRGCLVARDHSAAFAVAGDTVLIWPLPVIATRDQTLQLIDELVE